MQRLDNKSRMSGDVHVRFCERLRGKFPRPTRLIWWCPDKTTAKNSLQEIHSWLWLQRKLTIKPSTQIQSSKRGVTYCGFRLSQGAIRLTARKKQRFQERREYWEDLYQQGQIDALQLQRAYASVHAITAKTDSLQWRRENLRRHPAIEV